MMAKIRFRPQFDVGPESDFGLGSGFGPQFASGPESDVDPNYHLAQVQKLSLAKIEFGPNPDLAQNLIWPKIGSSCRTHPLQDYGPMFMPRATPKGRPGPEPRVAMCVWALGNEGDIRQLGFAAGQVPRELRFGPHSPRDGEVLSSGTPGP